MITIIISHVCKKPLRAVIIFLWLFYSFKLVNSLRLNRFYCQKVSEILHSPRKVIVVSIHICRALEVTKIIKYDWNLAKIQFATSVIRRLLCYIVRYLDHNACFEPIYHCLDDAACKYYGRHFQCTRVLERNDFYRTAT